MDITHCLDVLFYISFPFSAQAINGSPQILVFVALSKFCLLPSLLIPVLPTIYTNSLICHWLLSSPHHCSICSKPSFPIVCPRNCMRIFLILTIRVHFVSIFLQNYSLLFFVSNQILLFLNILLRLRKDFNVPFSVLFKKKNYIDI